MSSDYFTELVPSKPATDDADLLGGMSEESPVHALPVQPRSPVPQRPTDGGLAGNVATGLPSLSKEETRSANEQVRYASCETRSIIAQAWLVASAMASRDLLLSDLRHGPFACTTVVAMDS